eukprot:5148910-Pleurochrysis_carterae.AAC.1
MSQPPVCSHKFATTSNFGMHETISRLASPRLAKAKQQGHKKPCLSSKAGDGSAHPAHQRPDVVVLELERERLGGGHRGRGQDGRGAVLRVVCLVHGELCQQRLWIHAAKRTPMDSSGVQSFFEPSRAHSVKSRPSSLSTFDVQDLHTV